MGLKLLYSYNINYYCIPLPLVTEVFKYKELVWICGGNQQDVNRGLCVELDRRPWTLGCEIRRGLSPGAIAQGYLQKESRRRPEQILSILLSIAIADCRLQWEISLGFHVYIRTFRILILRFSLRDVTEKKLSASRTLRQNLRSDVTSGLRQQRHRSYQCEDTELYKIYRQWNCNWR